MISCPICLVPADVKFQTTDINRRLSQDAFTYYQCPNCKLVFLWPIPTDLVKYYPSTYYEAPASLADLAQAAYRHQHKLHLVQRFKPTGKTLEIGTSYGDFIYQLVNAGYEVEGIEMDADCCETINKYFSIPIENTNNVADSLRRSVNYDIIAMWQVIEHLPEFAEILELSAKLLRTEGILVLSAPNPEALQFRLFGRYWAHVDAPRHLQLIPIEVLISITKEYNMELIYAETCDTEGQNAEQFGWIKSIMNRLNLFIEPSLGSLPHPHEQRSLKYRLSRSGLRAIVNLLITVTHPFTCRKAQGSSYTLIFQKHE